jgi:hypothetical protein
MKKIFLGKYLFPLLLVAIVFLAYGNTLTNEFIFLDDYKCILNNPLVTGFNFNLSSFKAVFFPPAEYLGKHIIFVAPLGNLSFAINYKLAGFCAWRFHLINIIIYVFSVLFAYYLFLHILKNKTTAFVAAVIFALFPAHVESVAWVTGRCYALGSIFFFLSMLWYINKRIIFSLLSMVVAALCHPSFVILPLFLILYDVCFETDSIKTLFQKNAKTYFLFFCLALLSWLYLSGCTAGSENLLQSVTPRTFFTRTALPFTMMLFPFRISYFGYNFHSLGGPLLIEHIKMAFFIIATIFSFGLYSFFTNKKIVAFAVFWAFIWLLFFTPFSIFERYFYMPAFGVALLFAYYLEILYKSKIGAGKFSAKILAIVLFVAIVSCYLILTVTKNTYWQNNYQFNKYLYAGGQSEAMAHLRAARSYILIKDYDKALDHYLKIDAAYLKRNPELHEEIKQFN